MTLLETILVGLALSADAFSVCVSSSIVYRNLSKAKRYSMPIAFAIFQALMPILGYFFGYLFRELILKWQGPIALILLTIVGGNMIWEGFHPKDEEEPSKKLTILTLVVLAISTSIDALAVGISFLALNISTSLIPPLSNIFIVSSIIGLTTLVCCFIALYLGKKIGDKFGSKAEIAGGIVLIIIGLKAMFF